MMNAGNKKGILILLALAMLFCGVMALGSTLATLDYVNKDSTPKTTVNPDKGRYDVTLNYHDGSNYSTSLLDVPVFTSNVPWCPGYTKIVYLEVENNEEFTVECTLNMDIGESLLNSVMAYSVLDSVMPPTNPTERYPASWRDIELSQEWKVTPLSQGSHPIFNLLTLTPGQAHYYAIAIHMDETANNTHQGKTMSVGFDFHINANYEPSPTPN